jgi:ABC-2 type transport system ATP-binding protein
MPEPIIVLEALEKRFGSVRAVSGLDLAIEPGPVGLLGPNGAGKTTLLKLMLGLLAPDRGHARIGGFNPRRRADRLELRRIVGYMPESDCLIPGMNAVELVSTLGRLTGLAAADAMTRAHEVLDYVGLDEARYRGLDEYSTGMKQRLKLAQALVHDPAILLLDEPTNGLDPKGRVHMLDLVHDLGHAQGKSLLLCSHLLPDIERTCERVVVLYKGAVVESGSIAELTHRDERWVEAEVDDGADLFARALQGAGLVHEGVGPRRFRVKLAPEAGDEVFRLAAENGLALIAFRPERSTLEQVFLGALEEAEAEAAR